MTELRYRMEVMAMLVLSFMVMMFAISINDVYVFIFFHTIFPLAFITAAMWKEGRMFQ